MTVSFDVEDGTDFDSFRDELQQDGLTAYEMRSIDDSVPPQSVNPGVTMSVINVNPGNQDYIPGNTATNSIQGGYRMHADDNGIYMYLPAQYNLAGNTDVPFDLMTWQQLGLSEWASGDSVNPIGNTVTQDEKYKRYTYYDSITNSTIEFTIDSEISKQELIDSINGDIQTGHVDPQCWSFKVTTNNTMNFGVSSTGTGTTITHYSHSGSLDTYGTQYYMGRTMNTPLVLRTSQQVTYTSAGDKLSFTMTDANGKIYTFEAGNIKTSVSDAVGTTNNNSDFNRYIRDYISRYEQYLNNTQGGTGFSYPGPYSDFNTIMFQDAANGYQMSLRYTDSFNCLKNSDFTISYTTNQFTGRRTYTVAQNGNLATKYKNDIDTQINNIYDALKKTSISVTAQNTTGTQTTATTDIAHPKTTNNHRYQSNVTSGIRKVMIQAGPRRNQSIAIELPAMNTGILKIGSVNISTYEGATAAIGAISGAVEYISNMRTGYGATHNRLEYAMALNDTSEENAQATESRIRDADMADEMVIYSKNNILIQAAQSVLAQNNQAPERVLTLLQ